MRAFTIEFYLYITELHVGKKGKQSKLHPHPSTTRVKRKIMSLNSVYLEEEELLPSSSLYRLPMAPVSRSRPSSPDVDCILALRSD